MTITYHDLMHAARAALRAAGVDDEANKLEAQDLICAAAGKTPEQLYRDFSLYTTDAIAETIEKYMDRRLAGEPIAYIIGEGMTDAAAVADGKEKTKE